MNRANGVDVSKHKSPLAPGDMRKLYDSKVLPNDSPVSLQHKFFFCFFLGGLVFLNLLAFWL